MRETRNDTSEIFLIKISGKALFCTKIDNFASHERESDKKVES